MCLPGGLHVISHSMQLSRSFRRRGYHVTDRQHEMPCLDGQETIMTQQIEKKKSFWYNISIILENQKQLFSVYIHPMNRLLSSQFRPTYVNHHTLELIHKIKCIDMFSVKINKNKQNEYILISWIVGYAHLDFISFFFFFFFQQTIPCFCSTNSSIKCT